MTKRIFVLPDTQIPYHDRKALKAVIQAIGDLQPDELVHIGDLLDLPQPSRWSKGTAAEFEGSVFEDSETAKRVLLDEIRAVYDGPFGVHEGNHDCLDSLTRAVTRRGFVRVEDLTVHDEVMSVNDAGSTIWQTINEIVRFPFSGEMYSFGGRDVSAVVTGNHRVVGLNRDKTKWVEYTPTTLPGHKMWAFTAGTGNSDDYPISDNEIRLAVWALTDSHRTQDGRWTFYQSGLKAERPRKLLANQGWDFKEVARNRNITEIDGKILKKPPQQQYEFRLGHQIELDDLIDNGRRDLPSWALSLSERQSRVFFDEYTYTDGTDYNRGGSAFVLYVCKDEMREQLQILAGANGLRTSATEYRPGHWRLNVCDRKMSGIYRKEVEKVSYDGEVWCLRVPNERFFVERDGRMHLTGNSRARDYLSKYAPALAESGAFNIETLLSFDDYGIDLLPEFNKIAPGWITTHGHRGMISLSQIAGNTALNAAKKFGVSVVMGHTHRGAIGSHTSGYGGNVARTLTGMEVGNLMDMKMAHYLKGGTGNWQQGFGLLTVDGQHVTPVFVPISRGKFSVDGHTWEV